MAGRLAEGSLRPFFLGPLEGPPRGLLCRPGGARDASLITRVISLSKGGQDGKFFARTEHGRGRAAQTSSGPLYRSNNSWRQPLAWLPRVLEGYFFLKPG